VKRDSEHPEVRWAGKGDVVVADPARVKSALLSFIEAQAWWGREGPITIEGGRVDDRLQLTVWRDGTELTTVEAEALFAARRPGTGAGSKIGLFVTRGVAVAQGGRAWADVADGRLSFHLDIPLATPG
jgi:signal transduction histidine kinase